MNFSNQFIEPSYISDINIQELQNLPKEMLILKVQNYVNLVNNLIKKVQFLEKRNQKLEQYIRDIALIVTYSSINEPNIENLSKRIIDAIVKERQEMIKKIEQLEQEKQQLIYEKEIIEKKLLTVLSSTTTEKEQNKNSDQIEKQSEISQNIIKLSPLAENIVKVIGKYGVAESSDIEKCLKDEGIKCTSISVTNNLKFLIEMEILSNYQISTGRRTFFVYQLTETGKVLYKTLYNEEPVESEIERLRKEHDNLEHAYVIKDVCKVLKEKLNYKRVSMDREQNTIKLPNGQAYIADIIGEDENGKVKYFEVELGNTPQDEFNNKLRKMLTITNVIYIITTSEEIIKSKLEGQVKAFLKYLEDDLKKNLRINLTTTSLLERGKYVRQFN